MGPPVGLQNWSDFAHVLVTFTKSIEKPPVLCLYCARSVLSLAFYKRVSDVLFRQAKYPCSLPSPRPARRISCRARLCHRRGAGASGLWIRRFDLCQLSARRAAPGNLPTKDAKFFEFEFHLRLQWVRPWNRWPGGHRAKRRCSGNHRASGGRHLRQRWHHHIDNRHADCWRVVRSAPECRASM